MRWSVRADSDNYGASLVHLRGLAGGDDGSLPNCAPAGRTIIETRIAERAECAVAIGQEWAR